MQELVERQGEERGEGIAVECGGSSLSYGELSRRSNQLGHYLRRMGVGPEVRVVLCVERSLSMVVSVLGIVKAGGAYVPLDPGQPEERLRYVVEDSGARVVLTEERYEGVLRGIGARLVVWERDREEIEEEVGEEVRSGVSREHLAYAIYTSGSTGRPKGVELTHGGLWNLVQWHCEEYGVTERDRATQLSSASFDASVWELWPYLVKGARVLIVEEESRRSPSELREFVESEKVTLSFVPTPMAELLLEEEWSGRLSLRTMLTGGDSSASISESGDGVRVEEPLRSDRKHGSGDERDGEWRRGRGSTFDRSSDSQHGGIRTGRVAGTFAGGSVRGAMRRRGGIGARVLGTSGADGGEVRAGPGW